MEQYRKIAILENEFEAQIIQSVLEERGIPHYFKSFHDIAYDGLFQSSYGWGAIFAPTDYEHKIMEIIENLRKES